MELISKNKLKEFNKLASSKERNKKKLFLVRDLNSINKAKELNLLEEAYKTSDGVIASIRFLPPRPLGDHIIYLDEISDPTNLGKIIYLMHKYGYKDLMLSPKCVSIYNEKCLEVCKDLIFDINVVNGDINKVKELKNQYQILVTALKEESVYIENLKPKKKYILVLGNEARGVNPSLIKLADEVVKIRIKNIDSLNVSVAASIILDNLSL